MKWFKNIGPATLVTAAFIGPGTVTLCTVAGTQFGYSLLWAMLFSILATIVLQEMAARIGLVSGKGLAAYIRDEVGHPITKLLALGLIVSAIAIGNLAYEAGNITGAMLGIKIFYVEGRTLSPESTVNFINLFIGALAFLFLLGGSYKTLQKILLVAVVLMSLSFLMTALVTRPSLIEVFQGLLLPSVSSDNLLMVVSLIGTTIVPYNLFLHSSLVKQKWTDTSRLKEVQSDTVTAVAVGGIVSLSIIVCAARLQGMDVKNATDLALALEPLFGNFSKYFLAVGLFSAGLSSAITAPFAAAIVVGECFGWPPDFKSWRFRFVWMFILLAGTIFSTFGIEPVALIKFAQIINGLLLPIATGLVLWAMNNTRSMKGFRNSPFQNIIGVTVFVITLFLGSKSIVLLLL
ncbi:MAG: Nramp family divalent metal transporter [Cyclobacteriaceae bacterium]